VLGQQSLSKAEQQLVDENYGAAIFFALKAQDMATRAQDPDARRSTPAPQQVTVRVARANLRQRPEPAAGVVGHVPRGTLLTVKRTQGDWLEVSSGALSGWIARSVVE
jgi:SH3-like domain-containing protein